MIKIGQRFGHQGETVEVVEVITWDPTLVRVAVLDAEGLSPVHDLVKITDLVK